MAINNVRFEPRSQLLAPPRIVWERADYKISVGEVLAITGEYFTIPDVVGVFSNLMNLSIQALASNSAPLSLLIETGQNGDINGTVHAELSPGGTFDYEHMNLSMVQLFNSGADFNSAGLDVLSIQVPKASLDRYSTYSGFLDISVTGARAFFP